MNKRAASIGTFDGVHLGHRQVLKLLKEKALEAGLEPVVFTFSKHPLSVINPEKLPKSLTDIDKKCNLIRKEGVGPLILNFDRHMQSLTAEEMLKSLREDEDVEMLILGYDNKFGCNGKNLSRNDYVELGEKNGIKVIIADELKGISSSAIRKAIEDGDMKIARQMLGRPFSITGTVVEGNKIGRQIGFPTANIEIPSASVVPKPGVYAGRVVAEGIFKPALINIGVRPTVSNDNKPIIETHLIDWNGDLYGKEIIVEFLKRVRDEKKFSSIEELKSQIIKDKQELFNTVVSSQDNNQPNHDF